MSALIALEVEQQTLIAVLLITRSQDSQMVEVIGASLLCHASPQVRTAAFSMIINSFAVTRSLGENILNALRLALPCFHVEVNPKLRQDNLAMIKRLLTQLATSVRSSKRSFKTHSPQGSWATQGNTDSTADVRSNLEDHDYRRLKDFLIWYFGFLVQELSSTASYQRHVVSLKLLNFLLPILCSKQQSWIQYTSGTCTQEDWRINFDEEVLTSLLDLVFDPFDDVRDLAMLILDSQSTATWADGVLRAFSQIPNTYQSTRLISQQEYLANMPLALLTYPLIKVLLRAKSKMCTSGRADHADGFGRLYSLIHGPHGSVIEKGTRDKEPRIIFESLLLELEQCIVTANANLSLAVKAASLHGYLIAARLKMTILP